MLLLSTQQHRAALTQSDEASISALALLGARLALGGPLLGIACGVVGSFALGNNIAEHSYLNVRKCCFQY
jgi:hypothetical protein